MAGDLVLRPRDQGVTLTQWLYSELRKAILDGRLARGTKLMATRDLAEQYGISRRIVVNVFEQLRDEGYVIGKVGHGTVVSDNVPEDFTAKSSQRRPKTWPLQIQPPSYLKRPARPFRPIEPALSEFPMDTWARVAARCFRKSSVSTLAGTGAAGSPELRRAITEYLGSSRGVACTADQIFITSGTQQSLDIMARLLIRPGDMVWMEDPGYAGAVDAFRLSGAEICPVPVDENGLDPEAGRRACPMPRAMYLTPAHQFPLGATLRLDRRLDLLRWSQPNDVLIIEDDYDSEFRFSGKPVPAMKGLRASENVFLLGTFNKMLFPALRIGYMVVPDSWIEPMTRLRQVTERYPPGMSQVVLTAFIEEGHFGKHLRRMRELYGTRLRVLQQEIRRQLDGVIRTPEIQAGLNIPAFLTNGMNSREAADRARRENLEVLGLDESSLSGKDPGGLLLGFAAFTEKELREGVTALAKSLES